LNVRKVLLLAKQMQVHAEKTRGTGLEVTQKLHEETWNAASQSVQDPCGRPIAFENCRCSWYRSSWRSFGLENLFIFGNISYFHCNNTRDVTRGARGYNSRATNHCGGSKSHIKIVAYVCFRKTSGSNMGAPNLFLSPGAI